MMNKNYAVAMNDNELAKVSGGSVAGDISLGVLRGIGDFLTLGMVEYFIWVAKVAKGDRYKKK